MVIVDTKESRVFCFPKEIILAAQKEGVDLDSLDEMVRHSTRITHSQGNRRYQKWLFLVEGNDVLGFGRLEEGSQNKHRSRGMSFSGEVKEIIAKVGISPDTLNDMVKKSVPVNHPQGNRRYNGWLFNVNNGQIKNAVRTQDIGEAEQERGRITFEPLSSVDTELDLCETCFGAKKVNAFNPCERCDGKGCKYCDKGLIPGEIPCPVCT